MLGSVWDDMVVRVEATVEALFFTVISEQLFWRHTVSIVLNP